MKGFAALSAVVCLVGQANYVYSLVNHSGPEASSSSSSSLKPPPAAAAWNARKIKQSNGKVAENNHVISRRKALIAAVASYTACTASSSLQPRSASAYEKVFPGELSTEDGDLDSRQRRLDQMNSQSRRRASPLTTSPLSKPLGAMLWGSALWFLSGSRSNPLVTPLANIFYDETNEDFLKDRNEGYFANLPAPLFAVLAVVFLSIGFGADELATNLAEGDRMISLQLAGVSLISGGTLEIGRIASGEKRQTRQESDRHVQLEQEFAQFAASRLKPGGNCHRNEVVQAFRRYYAKYRVADNEDYPLGDLEIEGLLRSWSRPLPGVEMSSAGFYSGIQINQDADVFKAR